jgi:hypothetical protein
MGSAPALRGATASATAAATLHRFSDDGHARAVAHFHNVFVEKPHLLDSSAAPISRIDAATNAEASYECRRTPLGHIVVSLRARERASR